MKKWFLAICILFSVLFQAKLKAQNISNEGTEFWAVFPTHDPSGTNLANMNIFVTSKSNSEVTVSCGSYSEKKVIPANTVIAFAVPRDDSYISSTEANSNLTNRGIYIKVTESNAPVAVYGHVYAGARSAASLILPYAALGQRYYSMNYTQDANGRNFLVLVATEDNTVLKLTEKNGTTRTITLAKAGDVYEYLGSASQDITGVYVEVDQVTSRCKRFAAFSGSTSLTIQCTNSRDPLFQQLYTINSWGKVYAVVPFFNRRYNIRVLAQDNNTKVNINGTIVTINKGEFYQLSNLTEGVMISADKLVSVAQYSLTQVCSSITGGELIGDPDMILLNPVEFSITKITLFSSDQQAIQQKFINVAIKADSRNSFKVNGSLPTNGTWRIFPTNAAYSYIQIQVTQQSLTLSADEGFNATAYGFGSFESYAYSAGTSLASTQYLTSTNITTNVSSSNACVGESSSFKITIPYLLTRIVWNFRDGTENADDSNPNPEINVVNGETLYTYKAPENKTYLNVGERRVTATGYFPTDANSCFGSQADFDFTFNVDPLPTALFNVVDDQVCNGSITTFKDINTDQGAIVKWHWDYGDGTTEIRTDATPFTRTYPIGSYPVKLFVENQGGCLSEVFSRNVRVYTAPVSNFETSIVLCETKSVNFTSQSLSGEGAIVSWLWDFGDGTTSTDENPTHSFAAFRTYEVKLTVRTEFNCENTITKQVQINPLPLVSFELPDFCLADANAIFINTTTIPGNEQLTYLWDFGDPNANAQRPNTSADRDGKHEYTSTGVYEVTLTVNSSNGCAITVKKQFTVNGSVPEAAFEVINQNGLCSNSDVLFKDIATVNFGELTKIEWYFDFDNKTTVDLVDNEPNSRNATAKIYNFKYPTFTDALSKTYKVKMKAYSGGSCVSEVIKMITVYPDAIPNFQLQAACLPDGKASFNNLSTYIDANAVLTYQWDFGDILATSQNPNTSTDKNPVHNYTQVGKYNVKLTVKTPYGCETILVKEITIEGAVPIAEFSVKDDNNLCVQSPIIFEDKAILAFGEITRIDWYYDFINQPGQVETDLSPSTRTTSKSYQHQYPVFTFPFKKDFVVRMVVYSGTTCLGSIEKTITINASPDVEFLPLNPVCQEVPSISFSAREINNRPGTGIFSGNGVNASGVFVPSRAGVGVHTISYVFTPTNGCAITKTQLIIVNETPVIDAGEDKTVIEGGEGTLSATAYGADLTYKWTPSIGLDRDDVLNPIVRPTEDMVYTLRVTSGKGCFAIDEVKVKFLKNLVVPNAITPNGDGINDVWNIKYIDSYPTAKVEIYDRNGQRVFFSRGYAIPFDGTYHNKDLPVGTYYYLISLDTRKKPLSGTITIIR